MVKKPHQLEWVRLRRRYQQIDRYITDSTCTCRLVLCCNRDSISQLDAKINGRVFLSLNESRLSQFGISLGFKFAILGIIEDLVCSWVYCNSISACICCIQKSSQQLLSSERLPLQQQSPTSSVAIPGITQHQPSSSTTTTGQRAEGSHIIMSYKNTPAHMLHNVVWSRLVFKHRITVC